MTIKEIREMESPKLSEKLIELRDKAREARFGLANRQLKNMRELRTLKRDIASILTVLNERRTTTESK